MCNEKKDVFSGKICVTAEDGNLDAQVDPRFGRCRYFIIITPETMELYDIEAAYIIFHNPRHDIKSVLV